MKFIASSDWHLANKGPVTRKDDWVETMFSKLEQLARIARHVKARAILCGGDIFTKDSRVDWALMNRLLAWCFALKKDGIKIYTVPGNHDLKNDRYDSVFTQAIGVLFESGAMIDVSFRTLIEEANDGTYTVAITGLPYPHASNLQSYKELQPCLARTIVIAHCFATPQGGDYYGEPIISYQDLHSLPFDAYVFGHDHSDNGVKILVGKDGTRRVFVNNGALSRGSISKENIERTVKCTILDVTQEKVTAQEVRLDVKPVSEVFDLALKAQKDREESHVDDFVNKLSNDLVDTGNLDFQERLTKMELTDEVRTRVKKYIADSEKLAG